MSFERKLLGRVSTSAQLAYWRLEKKRAGDSFVNRKGSRPSILFNKDFLRYQKAWSKIGTLEAKLERLKKS